MFSEAIYIDRNESSSTRNAAEPLLESARFLAIRGAYESSDKTYEDAVFAAYDVARLLRSALKFSSHEAVQPELSPEWVAAGLTTNCHGHSIIASECLDAIGINHFVGFANQHSFLLMQDNESLRVNLIDTPDERLCIDISSAMGGVALREHATYAGSAQFISGDYILNQSLFPDRERALTRRPWLSTEQSAPTSNIQLPKPERYRTNKLLVRSYTPEHGRKALLAYDNFMHAMNRNELNRGHAWLQGLKGTYPDIDKRSKLKAPSLLVRALGQKALVDGALYDISIVEQSLEPFTNDIILRMWPADERRRLGVNVRSAEIVMMSLDNYAELYELRRDAGLSTADVEARIRAARLQLGTIG